MWMGDFLAISQTGELMRRKFYGCAISNTAVVLSRLNVQRPIFFWAMNDIVYLRVRH